jgi:hypothetical protein
MDFSLFLNTGYKHNFLRTAFAQCSSDETLAALTWNFRHPSCVGEHGMFTFILWCILFVLCWPLALVALVLYPIVWLILLPFRIVGIAVGGALHLVWAAVTLPFAVIRRLA